MTITVLYSCTLCGLKKVACDVSARGDEDVRDWMAQTVRTVTADHARRSPECHPRELTEVMIPMTGVDRIGGPTRQ